MIQREQALQYFRNECEKNGVSVKQADNMQEDTWKYWCYTYKEGLRGPGKTYIVKENGDIYNFGSNPLLSHVIDVPSYMEFVDAVHALCVERGREIDDEMSLGKIGNIGD